MKKEYSRSWRNRGNKWFVWAIVISVLIHGLLFFIANQSNLFSQHKKKLQKPIRVTIKAMPKQQWKNVPKVQTTKKSHKKIQQKKDSQMPKGQIVDIAKPKQEKRPAESRFLSEFNSKVKKETQSKYKAVFNQAAPKPTLISIKNKQKQKLQQSKKKKQIRINDLQKQEQKEQVKLGKKLKLQLAKIQPKEQLMLKKDKTGEFKFNKQAILGNKGNSKHTEIDIPIGNMGNDKTNKKANSVSLSPEDLAVLSVAGGPMADYLEEIEESNETALNTKAFRYATFFNRVKREVARSWHPARVHRKYDPYFKVYGYQDRRTVVYVTLDKQGNVEKVEVIEPSGVNFLDDEAVAAIYRASPFPNPPYGLIGKDNKIHFPFGFYFQISSVKFGPVFGN